MLHTPVTFWVVATFGRFVPPSGLSCTCLPEGWHGPEPYTPPYRPRSAATSPCFGVWVTLWHHHTTLLSVATAHFRAVRPTLAPSCIGHPVPAPEVLCFWSQLCSRPPSNTHSDHTAGPGCDSRRTIYTPRLQVWHSRYAQLLSLVGVFWDLVQDIMSRNPRLSVPALGHTPPCLVLVNIATAVFPSLHPMGPDRFRIFSSLPSSGWPWPRPSTGAAMTLRLL